MERLSALYASALFDLAMDRDAVDEFLSQTKFLLEMLQEDEDCMRVLLHPHIPAAEKQQLFKSAFTGCINDELFGFLFLVTDKNREAFLIPALTALIERIDRHMRKALAKVTSATELDEKQVAEIKDVLSGQLDKHIEVSLKVDPSIIGGPYIFVDGYYIDWTVKSHIRGLTVHLKEGCSA